MRVPANGVGYGMAEGWGGVRGRAFVACRVVGLVGSDGLGTRLRVILAALAASVFAIACGEEMSDIDVLDARY